MCLSTIYERSIDEGLYRLITVITTIIPRGGKGVLLSNGAFIRVIKRTLYYNACNMSIRTIYANARSTARAAHSGLRIFMGAICRFNFV